MARMKPAGYYLLCATDRSGSTWLTHGLSALGTAGRPREYFSPKYRTATGLAWSASNFENVLADVLRAGSTPNGVFGSKLMWWHLEQIYQHARRSPAHSGVELTDLMPRLLPNVKYVYLTRRDRLRQAISHLKAQQSGVWHHQRHLARRPQVGLSFDFFEIERRLRLIEECERQWECYFQRVGAAPLRLTYEQMLDDFSGALALVVDHLGIEAPRLLTEPPDAPLRLPDRVGEAWARKYEERLAIRERLPPLLHPPLRALLRAEGAFPRLPLGFLRHAYFGALKVPLLRPIAERTVGASTSSPETVRQASGKQRSLQ